MYHEYYVIHLKRDICCFNFIYFYFLCMCHQYSKLSQFHFQQTVAIFFVLTLKTKISFKECNLKV